MDGLAKALETLRWAHEVLTGQPSRVEDVARVAQCTVEEIEADLAERRAAIWRQLADLDMAVPDPPHRAQLLVARAEAAQHFATAADTILG